MSLWKCLFAAAAICSLGLVASGGLAQTDATAGAEAQPAEAATQPAEGSETEEESAEGGPAEFTEAFLYDPAHLAVGEEIWAGTCRGCHGKSAYPGKAPKLRPKRYTPEFVYDRVTNGFRKMPAWKDVYTKDERMGVTAYVLSEKFSP